MKNEKYRSSPRSPCVERESRFAVRNPPMQGDLGGLVFYYFSFLIFHLKVTSHSSSFLEGLA